MSDGVAQSAVAIPDSPAGAILKAWMAAFNPADSAALNAYVRDHQPQAVAANQLRLARATGGFELRRIIVNQPQHLEFILRENKRGTGARATIDVRADDPAKAQLFSIMAIPEGAPQDGCTTYTQASTHGSAGVDAKDVSSQDAILAALYDVISGPACQRRDWDRFRSLFAPGARLIPTGVGPDRHAVARASTPDEYAANAMRSLEESGFFEKEVARTGETFGAITHAFSTYESRRTANDEKPFARGINSIQLLNDGTRWWIVTVYWQAERPDTPIPAEYLKKPND
jgi:hypothetical protein